MNTRQERDFKLKNILQAVSFNSLFTPKTHNPHRSHLFFVAVCGFSLFFLFLSKGVTNLFLDWAVVLQWILYHQCLWTTPGEPEKFRTCHQQIPMQQQEPNPLVVQVQSVFIAFVFPRAGNFQTAIASNKGWCGTKSLNPSVLYFSACSNPDHRHEHWAQSRPWNHLWSVHTGSHHFSYLTGYTNNSFFRKRFKIFF